MVNFEIAAKEFQSSSDNLDELIKSPDNKKVIWFNSLEQVVSLISGVNHNILAAVKTGNNITIGYLKKKFGLDHYQAQARIDSLIDAGLVVAVEDGKKTYYVATYSKINITVH